MMTVMNNASHAIFYGKFFIIYIELVKPAKIQQIIAQVAIQSCIEI